MALLHDFFRCRWDCERKTPVKFLKIAKEKVKKVIIVMMKHRETKEDMEDDSPFKIYFENYG